MSAITKCNKKIPRFKSEDEEREFWATHDSTDYVDLRNAQQAWLAEKIAENSKRHKTA